jgi:hypothetical protein
LDDGIVATIYYSDMGSIPEIEAAVRGLSPSDLSDFRKWFQEFDAEALDRQLEQDVQFGRLDALAEEAINDAQEGRCTDL